ncbi:MAG: tetratricopeptide repeat protein [Bacteroidota bacterium]
MFEEDDDYMEGYLNEDLASFERYLTGESMGFLDSDRLEILLDHLLMNSQYQKAALCADYAIEQFSFYQVFHLRKAQAIAAMGQLREALNILAKIEKMDLPSVEFWLTKASIFSQIKDSKNAIKFFKEALAVSEPEDRDEIYLDLAMEHENLRDYRAAVAVLREAIKFNPFNEGAIYEIAFCYDQLGEYDSAIQCYSDYIDENPYSFTAWYNLGNAYTKIEKYDKAVVAYEYCVVINEDFGPVFFNLANTLLAQEKYTEAIENFQRCIEVDGEDFMAFCYIGEAYEQLNDLDNATLYYRKSLDLAPDNADAWLGLGIVEDLRGNTREALSLLHKAAELDAENASIYHVLAEAYEKVEDYTSAIEYFQLALALDPSDEECLEDYVTLLCEKVSIIDALEFVNDFIANVGENKIAEILQTNLLYLSGNKELAVVIFANCVNADKENAKELFRINPALKEIESFIRIIE